MKPEIEVIKIKRPLFWWFHRTFKTRTFVMWNEFREVIDFMNEIKTGVLILDKIFSNNEIQSEIHEVLH